MEKVANKQISNEIKKQSIEEIKHLMRVKGFVQSSDARKLEELVSLFGTEKEYFNIQPKPKDTALGNTLSSRFGLGEFPLHTDGAGKILPPKYIFLEFQGAFASSVSISLFDLNFIRETSECRKYMHRYIFSVKNGVRNFISPIFNQNKHGDFFRYNPAIMKPLNDDAKKISSLIETNSSSHTGLITFFPSEGSAIFIDNHRLLHSRGAMSEGVSEGRSVRRIWINDFGGQNDVG